MASFTFSEEEVRDAPLEVRRWIENQILKALSSHGGPAGEGASVEAETLAACSVEEAARIFSLVSHNFLATQVFFELARENPLARDGRLLHGVHLGEMQRHIQLDDRRLLIECLGAINQALRRIRNDPATSLFAADEQGRIFIHETSFRSIRKLREQLLAAHSSGAAQQAVESGVCGEGRLEGSEPKLSPEYAFGGNPPRSGE